MQLKAALNHDISTVSLIGVLTQQVSLSSEIKADKGRVQIGHRLGNDLLSLVFESAAA